MEKNSKKTECVDPSVIWELLMDYICQKGKQMKNKYHKEHERLRKPITWKEIDELTNNLHTDVNLIVYGTKMGGN